MIALLAQDPIPEPVSKMTLVNAIRDALRTGPDGSEIVWLIVGVIAFLVVIGVAARYFSRGHHTTSEPDVDYLTLAVDLVGLSEQNRRDLQRIAKEAEIEQPASMLLTPQNLARATEAAQRSQPDATLRRRMDDLSQTLFAASLPDVTPDNVRSSTRAPAGATPN